MAPATKKTQRGHLISCLFTRKCTLQLVPVYPTETTTEPEAPTENETSSSSNTNYPLIQHLPAPQRPPLQPPHVWNRQSISSEVTIDPLLLMTIVAESDYPGVQSTRRGHSDADEIKDASGSELGDASSDDDTIGSSSYLFDASMISDVTGYDRISI